MDAFRHNLFLRSVVRAVQRAVAVHVNAITAFVEISTMRLIGTRLDANVGWGEGCRTKARHAAQQSARLHPYAERAQCYRHHHVTMNHPGWLDVFIISLFFVPIRSNRDLNGGERSGEPIWGEEWVICRNEQPREVVRNGRYAQHFIYSPAMLVTARLLLDSLPFYSPGISGPGWWPLCVAKSICFNFIRNL